MTSCRKILNLTQNIELDKLVNPSRDIVRFGGLATELALSFQIYQIL